MAKVLVSDMVISLILVVVVVTGMLSFGGAIFSNYNTTLSANANSSISNISTQTEGIQALAENVYDTSVTSDNREIGIFEGVTVWVGTSVSAILTAVTGVSYLSNVGNVLATNLGVDPAIASVIILAVVMTVIFGFVATMFGRDQV